jgi:hypothetical protein
LDKKDKTFFHLYFFSSDFGRQNPVAGLEPEPDLYPDPDSLEMLDPDPDPRFN